MQVFDERATLFVSCALSSVSIKAIDLALDVEDRIDPCNGRERNGRDGYRGFAASRIGRDV